MHVLRITMHKSGVPDDDVMATGGGCLFGLGVVFVLAALAAAVVMGS